MLNRQEAAKKLRDGGIARNVEEAYVLILSHVGFRCSNCGAAFPHINGEYQYFPNCGARVVRDE